MNPITDTHCHLDFARFDDDRAEVISRAEAAGVIRILNPAIDIASSGQAIHLAESYARVFAAVGVHPNSGNTWNGTTLATLGDIARHPKVVAIGEIGLDYYRDYTTPELQRTVLEAQLQLAERLILPVIIHHREAMSDLWPMLASWQAGLRQSGSALAERPGVLHSFSGSLEDAEAGMAAGFYIGITGPVTFRNARELQNIIRRLPLSHLLVETDAPFLSPHPKRGKRNEPENVRLIIDQLAQLHGCTPGEVAETTTANAQHLFQWENQIDHRDVFNARPNGYRTG